MSNALQYWSKGQFDQAYKAASQAVVRDPGDGKHAALAAQALATRNDIQQALSILDDAIHSKAEIKLVSDDAIHSKAEIKLVNIARGISMKYGHFLSGIKYTSRLLEIAPSNPKHHAFYLQCLISAGYFYLAERYVDGKSVELNSKPVEKYRKYLEDCRKIQKTDPVYATAWQYCLREKRAPETSQQEFTMADQIPIIQYWSQGSPPHDVNIVVAHWNRILSEAGLGQIDLYDKKRARQWIKENTPEFSAAFDASFHFAMEADIFRVAFASKVACVYIDIDCWPLENTVELLKFGIKSHKNMLYIRSYRPWLVNCFFISRPENAFTRELAQQCREVDFEGMEKNNATIELCYGPHRYNKVLIDVLRRQSSLKAERVHSVSGCSRLDLDSDSLYLTHDAAIAAPAPLFNLAYKQTESNWKVLGS